MGSSHVEEVAKQVRGRDLDPPAKGRGKKNKSRDPLTSFHELGRSGDPVGGRYGGHQRGDGPHGAKHGEGRGGSEGADPRPSRGDAWLAGPGGVA